jgi:hypothetical protein
VPSWHRLGPTFEMSTLIDLVRWIVDCCTYWRFWIPVVGTGPAFLLNYYLPGEFWPWFISVPVVVLGLAVGSWWQFVWHRDQG